MKSQHLALLKHRFLPCHHRAASLLVSLLNSPELYHFHEPELSEVCRILARVDTCEADVFWQTFVEKFDAGRDDEIVPYVRSFVAKHTPQRLSFFDRLGISLVTWVWRRC